MVLAPQVDALAYRGALVVEWGFLLSFSSSGFSLWDGFVFYPVG